MYNKDLYTSDDVEVMVEDYLSDHFDMDCDDLVLDGAPYYDEDEGQWQQDAHDESTTYLLVADAEGNIDIRYVAGR